MTWKTPKEAIAVIEEAVKWWLGEHFVPSDHTNGTWAMDLYASYLEACVDTGKLPIVTASLFGRVMTTLVPRSPYITRGKEHDQRSGRQYMVKPMEDVRVVVVGKVANGAATAHRLYGEAQGRTGHVQTPGWFSWNEEVGRDKQALSDWLASQKLEPVQDGSRVVNPPSVTSLYKRFKETLVDEHWTEARFRRALSNITRIKRGHGGARTVAELKEVA